MRPFAKRLAVGALLGLAFAPAEVFGQAAPSDKAATETEISPTVAPVGKSPTEQQPQSEKSDPPKKVAEAPPVQYVRDKQGRLVPLLGFTLDDIEDLQEFLRRKKAGSNGAVAPPKFDLQQLVVDGEAGEARAELTATYRIRLSSENWVEIPLVSGGAVLTEPAVYQGDGEQSVQFDQASGAYSARIRGSPNSLHELVLKLSATIRSVGGQRRMELDLPTAAASRLTLQVPLESVTVTANTGAVSAEARGAKQGKSEISAWGLGGPLSLAWKEGAGPVAAATSRLEAEGKILARLDSRSVRFDATITVKSMADAFDRFQIKLPPKTIYVPSETANPNYTLTGGMDDGNVVAVQLPQKTKGPVEVQLRAERPHDSKDSDESLELAGFEVVEAIPHRQWGHMAIVVSGDWQLTVDKTERVRRTEELPAAVNEDGALGFRYDGQPCSLAVKVAPRKTRIAVEPEYVFFVEPDQVRLEATLRYNIGGAKTFDLAIEMPGWEPDELGPATHVDLEAWNGEAALLTVPLLEPVNGKFELKIVAHRSRVSDFDPVEIALPIPRAEVLKPALVAIVPANNVRLRPNDEEVVGLNRIASASGLRLPSREQSPLIYRAENPQAKFVAAAERLPQTITVAAEGTVDVRQTGILVEQRLRYRVEHEPLDELALEIPRQLDHGGDLEITVDDIRIIPLATTSETGDGSLVLRAPFPEPRSGIFTVVIKSQQRLGQQDLDTGEPVSVSLVVPHNLPLARNRLTVVREPALGVVNYDENWAFEEDSAPSPNGNGVPSLNLSASEARSSLQLTVHREQRRSAGSTIVERGWIQSWIGGGVRRDRAAFRINSSEGQVNIELPEGVALEYVQIKVNQETIPLSAEPKRTITLNLNGSNSEFHVVELIYRFGENETDVGSIDARLPRFVGNVGVQHLYWQLAIPGDRHLVDAADELTPEFTWQWNGIGWERRSSEAQTDLRMVGVTSDHELPAATNQYLFSLAGSPSNLAVVTAARGHLVFWISIVVLAIGLLLIYFRALRRPAALLTIGVVIAALATWQTESALLFVQAALLGVGMVVLAVLLELVQSRRRRAPAIVRSGGSSIIETRSTPTSVRTAEPLAPPSTESLPVDVDVPAAESSSR